MKKCEELVLEYIFVLKDKKIPTLTREFLDLVSLPEGNRQLVENEKEIILTMWVNEIDYHGIKTNIIRQYTIIQITHLILQIIEYSDICGEFNKK